MPHKTDEAHRTFPPFWPAVLLYLKILPIKGSTPLLKHRQYVAKSNRCSGRKTAETLC